MFLVVISILTTAAYAARALQDLLELWASEELDLAREEDRRRPSAFSQQQLHDRYFACFVEVALGPQVLLVPSTRFVSVFVHLGSPSPGLPTAFSHAKLFFLRTMALCWSC